MKKDNVIKIKDNKPFLPYTHVVFETNDLILRKRGDAPLSDEAVDKLFEAMLNFILDREDAK